MSGAIVQPWHMCAIRVPCRRETRWRRAVLVGAERYGL